MSRSSELFASTFVINISYGNMGQSGIMGEKTDWTFGENGLPNLN